MSRSRVPGSRTASVLTVRLLTDLGDSRQSLLSCQGECGSWGQAIDWRARVAHNSAMPGRECYHCKQWIEEGEAHDCWTTTEAALTQDLPDDLREAWERIRETAVEF